MGLPIDPSTMFLALVASTAAAVMLLLWVLPPELSAASSWRRCPSAFSIASIANLLFGKRGVLPQPVVVDGGVALLLVGPSCMWSAARVFNGRRVTLGAARRSAPLAADLPRAGLLRQFRRPLHWCKHPRRGLLLRRRPRVPGEGRPSYTELRFIVLAAQGVIVLLRIPFIIMDGQKASSPSRGPPGSA